MNVTVPENDFPGKVSTRTSAFWPGLTLPISVSSTKIFRSTVSSRERVRTSRPGVTTSPGSMFRLVMTPAEGAFNRAYSSWIDA